MVEGKVNGRVTGTVKGTVGIEPTLVDICPKSNELANFGKKKAFLLITSRQFGTEKSPVSCSCKNVRFF